MSLEDFFHDPGPQQLECGWVNLPELESRIIRIERSRAALADEQALTYLCAYGYAIAQNGPRTLARVLCGNGNIEYDGKLWFEFLPASPRNGEGKTHFDLALGDVKKRPPTRSGLEFAHPGTRASWALAVEAKLQSDLSASVSYDTFRNQLLRVIENALTIRDANDRMPASVHVALVTPDVFKQNPRTRFYGCKFEEYCPDGHVDSKAIIGDLMRLQLQTPAYNFDIAERLKALSLRWVTFEDVLSNMPDGGGFKASVVQLISRGGSLVTIE